MGYFSCKSACSVSACDVYDSPWELRRFKVQKFQFSDLESATDGFSAANLLGRGSYGNVYIAKLPRIKTVVAVKMTKEAHPSSCVAADNEVEILSCVSHPRLVNLIGYAEDSDRRKMIVVEYMANGTLHDLLHRSEKPLRWVKRMRFALQVAKAVQFLHSSNPPIIHRDIKSSNVLIDARFNSRISDFGLALRGHAEDVRAKSTPPAGTIGYLDPGYVVPGDLSAKSDVFSFGILLLEIISGRHAIDLNYSPPSVVDWAVPEIKSGNLAAICDPRIGPPEDAKALRMMAVLALRCVRRTAANRPAMSETVECLKEVFRRMRRRQPERCINLRRHVVEDPRHVIKYEPLDDSKDSRKGGKLFAAASTMTDNDVATLDLKEIKFDNSIKSKSMDEMDGGRLDGAGDDNEMSSRRLELSMLLVNKGENVKEEEN